MDCKQALTETQGDLEKAKQWISERSKVVAAKIASRSAKQGLIGMSMFHSTGALVEVNCETDFVARGQDFQDLVRKQAEVTAKGEALSSDAVAQVAGKVRENIVLGGVLRLQANKSSVLEYYMHNRLGENVGSAAAVVSLTCEAGADKEKVKELAKAIAVQIVASKPLHLSKTQISPELVKEEEKRVLEELVNAVVGKPEKARESMIRGKMQKFFAEHCLLEQTFVLGELEGKVVKEVLPKQVQIEGFIRMAVGGDRVQS